MRSVVLSMLLLCAAASTAAAQRSAPPPVDSTAVVALRLIDGSELIGRVLAADDTSLTVLTLADARVVLPRRSIVSWSPRRGQLTSTGFQPVDPNTSRLFFGPTARTLESGSGYFADYYLFFPVVGVGVHDRVMLSGGMSIIPGVSSQIIYLGLKAAPIRTDEAAFAVGGFWGTIPDEPNASVGMGYAVTTLGSEDHAITIMGGLPFTTEEVAPEPVFMIGGESRIGRRAKLLGELWRVPEESEMPLILGVRWFGDRLAVDFGFLYVLGTSPEGWPLIPWVDFAVNW